MTPCPHAHARRLPTVCGGSGGEDDGFAYLADEDRWEAADFELIVEREQHAASVLDDGEGRTMIVTGGTNGAGYQVCEDMDAYCC